MQIIQKFRYLAESFYVRLLTYRLRIHIRVSAYRRARHKQYWQAGSIGGGATVPLGLMTEAEALAKIQFLKGDNEPVAFVDFERGFIAYGKFDHPGSAQ